MSTNDYVKYMTQQIVSYIDCPKEERKSRKAERKHASEPLLTRWFGMIPFAMMLLLKRKKSDKKS